MFNVRSILVISVDIYWSGLNISKVTLALPGPLMFNNYWELVLQMYYKLKKLYNYRISFVTVKSQGCGPNFRVIDRNVFSNVKKWESKKNSCFLFVGKEISSKKQGKEGRKQLKNYFELSLNKDIESFLVYFSVNHSKFISKTFCENIISFFVFLHYVSSFPTLLRGML